MASRAATPSSRFLGVRLSVEEERRLESFQAARGIANRSDAIRALLTEAKEEGAPPRVELPASRVRELESLVEDGWFSSAQSALEFALETGLAQIVRTHTEGVAALRRQARALRSEKDERRRADREGRELLRR